MCLCRLGSGPTHFGPKYKAEMGARGQLWIALFFWVAPLGGLLCPCGRVQTRVVHLGQPAGDAQRTDANGLRPFDMVQPEARVIGALSSGLTYSDRCVRCDPSMDQIWVTNASAWTEPNSARVKARKAATHY
jgi:hypothetical protein